MRTEYDDVIRAWIDGAEVEERHESENKWMPFEGIWVVDSESGWQYRIAKPAQEPKYLYAYLNYENGKIELEQQQRLVRSSEKYEYLCKIRLEE
jgi:hypothetical protein